MNRRTASRIATLEATAHGRQRTGCPTCSTWSTLVIVDDDENTSRPEHCPNCGRLVPITHEIHIVGMPLDAV
ncbi:MAG: hypothetical protein QM753_03275 [Thermomicrobiales bacterium]